MQFHLNGFRPGDPAVAQPVEERPDHVPLPDTVDVLIVGAGPTGLLLAAQLAAFPGITTRIVEQKPGRLMVGQADGIACRSVEMFEAFGFADKVVREAYWVNETAFWRPDPADPARIARADRIRDTEEGLSEFPHVILNQARVHDFFLDLMRDGPAPIRPDYNRRLLDLVREDSAADYPVTARVESTDPDRAGEVETLRARYVVGCDGARSRVRESIGRELRGDAANQAWGVMDVLAVTDFPDIRLKATVHSATQGNLLVIPREGGYLVRLYIELDKLAPEERIRSRNIQVDHLVAAAQRILHPYTLDVKEVAWWSVYEIGQRLCDRYDDGEGEGDGQGEGDGGEAGRDPRIFIAGDACHTHSPKAGQGMNVSMRDGFNLGWKLAAVLRGQCAPGLLRSYSAERQDVARMLIEFDREFARMFSARPKRSEEDEEGVDPALFQQYFQKHGRFTAGTAIRYAPSALVGDDGHQALARGVVPGMRFHSAPVIRLADARPLELGHVVRADGRWRLFAFADRADPTAADSPLGALCRFLDADPASPLRRITPGDADIDSVLDLRAVLQQGHRTLSLPDLPALLRPAKGRYGLIDQEKVFCADPARDIFDLRGLDRDRGALVLVRPDQHVSHLLPLDATAELAEALDGIFRPAT